MGGAGGNTHHPAPYTPFCAFCDLCGSPECDPEVPTGLRPSYDNGRMRDIKWELRTRRTTKPKAQSTENQERAEL